MNKLYRKFNNNDIKPLIILMDKLGYSHSQDSLMENICRLREGKGEVFVAELKGNVCGCVSAILDIRLAEGISGEIVSLSVLPEKRGLGIGKGLVREAESWLKQHTDKIRIRANSVRKKAHEFYKGMGYSEKKSQTIFSKNI